MRDPGWIGHTQQQIVSALSDDWMSVHEIMDATGLSIGQAHGALKGLRERDLVIFESEGPTRTARHRYRKRQE